MVRFILSWPMLIVWLMFSAAVFWIGAGFGGSWMAFTVGPPLADDPLGFVLWLAALCIVFAPAVLILARLLIIVFHRASHPPNP